MADDDSEINQPGLGALRAALATAKNRAVETAKNKTPSGRTITKEGTAGLTVAVGSVPDGMANALLAGVNPVFGLYANISAPIVGGALASSQLMVINSTSAGAIVAGQSVRGADNPAEALFLLEMVAGVFQLAFGLLKLGQLTRYISYSVMTGFVSGLAVVLALSQLPTVTGISVPDGSTLADTFHVVTHLGAIRPVTVLFAVLAGVLTPLLSRTPLSRIGALLAIVLPSVLVALLGVGDVAVVGDTGQIQSGLPSLFLPSLSTLSLDIILGAFALSVVVLVQGTGVSQSVSSTEGERGSISRDFVAQGAANLAAGVVRGLPVGGSFKGTALNASAGGQRRWATIFSGVWMLVIVLLFSGLVSDVAMPALGGLLIYISSRTIKPDEIRSVGRAGGSARLAGAVTFVATVALPIQFAILLGVVLAAVLYISESSTDLSVVELVEHDDGTVEERERPEEMRSDDVTVLDIYGHLFYAGADRLGRLLPSTERARRPAVVIRLRGRSAVGATVAETLSNFADRVISCGGQLYLTGLSEEALERLLREGAFHHSAGVHLYGATEFLGESTREAVADARAWLEGRGSSGQGGRPSTDDG